MFYINCIDKEKRMSIVTVSPKYQVVIPSELRKSLKIKPGQKLSVISFGDCIEFVPVRDIRKMRGFTKKVDAPPFVREEEERL